MFKTEWEGDGFVGLSAKCYYCFDKENGQKDKYSAKGLNKTIGMTRDHFLNVLKDKTNLPHTNKGFIFKDRHMFSYELTKKGLNYFYCKRCVLNDGRTTTYLDI